MADEPTNTPEPKPEPTPAPQSDSELLTEIRALKKSIIDLPGKMTATVTEDNERSIAERVYDLFDSGGAFDRTEPPKPTPDTKPDVTPEPEPKKRGKLSGFASWFAGEQ